MLPMPKLTPVMAAKCTGLIPSARATGRRIGVQSRTPLTSSINIPTKIIKIFISNSNKYLFVVSEVSVRRIF